MQNCSSGAEVKRSHMNDYALNRNQMKPVNLAELRDQFRGTRFYQLVQHHLRQQSQRERIHGFHGTVDLLPESTRNLVEEFIDRWNTRAYNRDFWQRDTADVFDEIINDARSILRPLGLATDDETAFNFFQIVVLNYAYSAYDQPKMREFMGIRPSFGLVQDLVENGGPPFPAEVLEAGGRSRPP